MTFAFRQNTGKAVHMPSAEHGGVAGQEINRGRQHCDGIYSVKQTKQSKTQSISLRRRGDCFNCLHRRLEFTKFPSVFLILMDTVNTHWVITMLCNWTGCFFQLRLWSLMWFHLVLHPCFTAFYFFLGHQTKYNIIQDPNRCKSSKMQQGTFTNVRI